MVSLFTRKKEKGGTGAPWRGVPHKSKVIDELYEGGMNDRPV
jgi:hypothetical protein